MLWLLLGVTLAIVAYLLLTRRKKERYLAACEYWVFLPGAEMPAQDAVMTRMISENAHGHSVIGSREGLLFSDIRLDMSLVQRSKNPHVFRPDLFVEWVEPTQEMLNAMAECNSLVKIRYVSEEPLSDDRHLTFTAHMADAVADLAQGKLVYDVVAARLMTAPEFAQALHEEPSAASTDFHVHIVWAKRDEAGRAETKGLMKKGLPELVTNDVDLDHEVLAREVLHEASLEVWKTGEAGDQLTVHCFGDEFPLTLLPAKDQMRTVLLARKHTT